MGCFHSKPTVQEVLDVEASRKTDSSFKGRYQLMEELGYGAFSSVRLALHKQTKQKFAVKCVRRTNLSASDEISLLSEVGLLTTLDHPHIIKLFDFCEEPDMFYLVTELMEGGELFDRIVDKTVYSEKEGRDLVKILLDAINYCHIKGIVHRDLKPENLLLKTKNDDSTIKIADFGFAKMMMDTNGLQTQCGTPGYVAPEILEGKGYGTEVDLWSIGVIMFVLLGGYPPFHDQRQLILFRKIRKGEFTFDPVYWNSVSNEAKDLISKLIVVDPQKRLTAMEALDHRWFRGDGHELSTRNLKENLKELKKYNTKMKFRAAVHAIVVTNRMTPSGNNHTNNDTNNIKNRDGNFENLDHQHEFSNNTQLV